VPVFRTLNNTKQLVHQGVAFIKTNWSVISRDLDVVILVIAEKREREK
jgi:hypothetical protein